MEREEFQRQFGILGQSVEIQEIVDVVRQVAPTDITVLVTGESGVGKEVIARAIHGASKRSKQSFVAVNCGAIPEGLIESELFGHEKGSFTSAVETRKGYFELADGGTIFLDEIGEMPLATQVKLLRVLENGEFSRIGSSVPKRVDVRVIAATNKNLEYEVQQRRFRPDLYFRLRSVNIWIPPLRNRRDDIPILVEHFVKEITEKNGITFLGFSDDATNVLMEYNWPGNVRELKNVLESMLVLERGKRITAEEVRKHLYGYEPKVIDRNLPAVTNKSVEQAERELIYRALLDLKNNIVQLHNLVAERLPASVPAPALPQGDNGIMTIEEMEKYLITQSLKRNRGNRRQAARELKISERTLYRKIKEYGLDV
jgi:transcriptional regulator with GAF, ATPase, and Fis domain